MGFTNASQDVTSDTKTMGDWELRQLAIRAKMFSGWSAKLLQPTRTPANLPYYQRRRDGKMKRY